MLPFSCLPTTPADSAIMVPEPQPGQLIFGNCLALSPLERGRWYRGIKWGPDLAPWITGLPCPYCVCMGYWGQSSGVLTLFFSFQLQEATWRKETEKIQASLLVEGLGPATQGEPSAQKGMPFPSPSFPLELHFSALSTTSHCGTSEAGEKGRRWRGATCASDSLWPTTLGAPFTETMSWQMFSIKDHVNKYFRLCRL